MAGYSICRVSLIAASVILASGCEAISGDGSSTTSGRSEIPRRATVVAEGRGNLSWSANADGTIYVQDSDRKSLLVEHDIDRGERLRVEPGDNRIRINDDTIYRDDLKSDHDHRVYFERDERSNETDSDEVVPKGADLVGRGKNREITYSAPRDGRVYLFDEDAKRVVNSAGIKDGERFTLSPGRGRATVDGKTAMSDRKTINPDTNYAVYFARD